MNTKERIRKDKANRIARTFRCCESFEINRMLWRNRDMQYNYVNIIIVVILLFGLGVVLSRIGGISGIVRKTRKAFRWLRGYKD